MPADSPKQYGVLEAVVPDAAAELWDLWCTEQGASGSEWEGGADTPAPPEWTGQHETELVAGGPLDLPAGCVRVRHYFDLLPQENPEGWAAGFQTCFPGTAAPVRLAWALKPVEAWATQWREHFAPLRVGKRLLVCPPWDRDVSQDDPSSAGLLRIVIDPGQGFGTGRHASTALALELIERAADRKGFRSKRVLDVGTGSGILLIAARLLGAGEAWACDIDAAVEPELGRNLHLSGVDEEVPPTVTFRIGTPADLLTEGAGEFTLVLANLTAPLLIGHAADVTRLTSPGGDLILSGMLTAEVPSVLAVFQPFGWREHGRAETSGWCGLWLTRVEH